MKYGERLRAAREKKKSQKRWYTLRNLAGLAGVAYGYLAAVEKGVYGPLKYKQTAVLCAKLGLDCESMMLQAAVERGCISGEFRDRIERLREIGDAVDLQMEVDND